MEQSKRIIIKKESYWKHVGEIKSNEEGFYIEAEKSYNPNHKLYKNDVINIEINGEWLTVLCYLKNNKLHWVELPYEREELLGGNELIESKTTELDLLADELINNGARNGKLIKGMDAFCYGERIIQEITTDWTDEDEEPVIITTIEPIVEPIAELTEQPKKRNRKSRPAEEKKGEKINIRINEKDKELLIKEYGSIAKAIDYLIKTTKLRL